MDTYKKKYDEALERAKAMIKVAANQDEAIGFVNTIFPELKESEESEGEKIREKLIDTFNFYDSAMNSPYLLGIHRNDIVAWLEKQGEQKPAEWSEDDNEYVESILERLEGMCKKGTTFTTTRFAVNQDIDWLKSLKERIGG